MLAALVAQAAPTTAPAAGGGIGSGIVGWLLGVPLILVLVFTAIVVIGKGHKGRVSEAFGVLAVVLVGLIVVGLARDPAEISTVSGGLVHLVFG